MLAAVWIVSKRNTESNRTIPCELSNYCIPITPAVLAGVFSCLSECSGVSIFQLVAFWTTLRYTISYRARWGGSGAL